MGVSTTTLRRWDTSGKFKSSRNPINQYRVYSEQNVRNLLKDLNLSPRSSETTDKAPRIRPFFKSERGTLYHADSLEVLKSIEPDSIDLIFADPPYNIKKAAWDHFASQQEYLDWSLKWIKEARRVLTPEGSLYVCGFSEILADLKYIAAPHFESCKWLVWFYRNKANLGKDWGRSHESILRLRKSKNYIFHMDQIRIPYNDHTTKYPKRTQADSSQYSNGKKHTWEPHPLGAKPKDVLEIPTISNGSWEKYGHETQKPVELLRKIILSSSNEDSTILDPFGGSGTTYAVAEAYGRKWIGIEREETYCGIIQERLSDKDHLARIRTAKDAIESNERRQKLRVK